MPAKLFCKTGELAGREHVIEREATIGSEPGNTVVIAAPSISRQHARVALDDEHGGWVVEDLQSRNGTRLDNLPVKGRERLGNLHVITFAELHDFVFQVVPAQETTLAEAARLKPAGLTSRTEWQADIGIPPSFDIGRSDRPSHTAGETVLALPEELRVPPELGAPGRRLSAADTVDMGPASEGIPFSLRGGGEPTVRTIEPATEVGGWFLEIQTQGAAGPTRMRLKEGANTIGRSVDCDVRIDDPTLSRRHAVITIAAGRVTVLDLTSANGTFVRDDPATKEIEVAPGTALRFGTLVTALVRNPSD